MVQQFHCCPLLDRPVYHVSIKVWHSKLNKMSGLSGFYRPAPPLSWMCYFSGYIVIHLPTSALPVHLISQSPRTLDSPYPKMKNEIIIWQPTPILIRPAGQVSQLPHWHSDPSPYWSRRQPLGHSSFILCLCLWVLGKGLLILIQNYVFIPADFSTSGLFI